MNHGDPMKIMKSIVNSLEREEKLRNRIDRVRKIDENTESTLERVLCERADIVKLLDQLKAPQAQYDYNYNENLVTALRSLLAPHLAVANATKR